MLHSSQQQPVSQLVSNQPRICLVLMVIMNDGGGVSTRDNFDCDNNSALIYFIL